MPFSMIPKNIRLNYMNKIIKKCVDAVCNEDTLQLSSLGHIIENILLKDMVVSMEKSSSTLTIYTKVHKEKKVSQDQRNNFLLITEFISVFSKLERDGLLYVIPNDEKSEGIFAFSDLYKSEKGYEIPTDDNNKIYKNGTCVFYGKEYPNSTKLCKELFRLLNSFVYPTASLITYKKKNYMDETTFRTVKSLALSRKSLWVAVGGIVIAAVISYKSISFSTYYNNKYGVTKLDSMQFEKIIETNVSTKIKSDSSVNK